MPNSHDRDDAEIQIKNDGPSLAVIGCGYWGSKHIRVACDIRGTRMAMAVDPQPERLQYIRSQYPSVAVSRDISAALNSPSIDAVILATPVETHFELARAALQAGKHVLVEKPMARTSAECR